MVIAYYFFSVLILVVSAYVYINISKINDDYFNLYMVRVANFILIQFIPTMLYFYYNKAMLLEYSVWTLVYASVMFILNILLIFVGYKFAFTYISESVHLNKVENNSFYKKLIKAIMNEISVYGRIDIKLYYIFVIGTLTISLLSFIILAKNSVGLHAWIFNNRYAYQVGRKGNGQFYILFELFLLISFTFSLVLVKKDLFKLVAVSLIYMILSYFSGSKYYILGIMLIGLLYYDHYIKKINAKILAISGGLLLTFLIVLLEVQSKMNLMSYADYYRNFLMLIEKFNLKFQAHTLGRYSFEETYWNYIPRSLNPNKPIIYGSINIPYKFFGKMVLQGNYPSFGELALPFVEFGIIGVILKALFTGITFGLVEKIYRSVKSIYDCNPILFVVFAYMGYISIPNVPPVYFYTILIIGHISIRIINYLYNRL